MSMGIAEWMSRVLQPGQCVEIRGLRPGNGGAISRHFYADAEGLAELEETARKWESEGVACYFVPNPVQAGLGESAASDSHVLLRRWLLIDLEPIRKPGTSSTQDERTEAWTVLDVVRDMLEGNGFPEVLVADSGNGFHVLVPCELPNDTASTTLCKAFLSGIANVFNSAKIKIDTCNFNASRIVRLYGTWNRKGVHSKERPHRRANVLTLPEHYDGVAGAAAIATVVERWKQQDAMRFSRPLATPSVASDVVQRARAYLRRADPAIQGQGGSQTCFRVACALVHGFSLTDEEALDAIADWNATCSPPWSEKELRHKFSDARKHDRHTKPRGHLLTEMLTPTPTTASRLIRRSEPATGEEEEMRLPLSADELMLREYEEVACVVASMIPKGLTILAGRPKQGKSWAALQMCLSVAMGIPFLSKEVEQGDVLYLALEDHPRRIKARITQLLGLPPYDAGLKRLSFFFGSDIPPGDMRPIEAWIKAAPKPRLVVIDTLGRFTPPSSRSSESFEQIYAVMAGVKTLADESGVAIVIVHHTRKQETENPLDAVSGSTAYTAAADAIIVLERNSQEKEASLVVTGRDFEEYTLNVQWDKAWNVGGGGRRRGTAASRGEPSRVAEAATWLISLLTEAVLPMRVKDVIDASGKLERPFSNGQLYKGRDAAGILENKLGNKTYWELPKAEPEELPE